MVPNQSLHCVYAQPQKLFLKAISLPLQSWGQSYEFLKMYVKRNVGLASWRKWKKCNAVTPCMYRCVSQEKVERRSRYRRGRYIFLGREIQWKSCAFLWKYVNWFCERVLTRMCVFLSVLRVADNKGVRSPCCMIKGLCSLAAVCPQKRGKEHNTEGTKKKCFICRSQPTQYFAIFLRLGLFERSHRWNAFKDNKEIKITFRNPYQGERRALKVNKAVQLSTISHFPLPPVTASDLA